MAQVHDEFHAKTIIYFRRFLVEEPRHLETVSAKEGIPLYRSTRLRVARREKRWEDKRIRPNK